MPSLPVITCRRLLDTLIAFYADLPHPPALNVEVVDTPEIPWPERELLVHDGDMTSTLERFHGEPIALKVLDRRLSRDHYARHIVLETARSRRPVEYGAIRVHLPSLDTAIQEEVLAAQVPLGGILNARGFRYRSCPGAFFKVHSNELMIKALQLPGPQWLYGRCNCLSGEDGHTIAEVVEIIPSGNNS